MRTGAALVIVANRRAEFGPAGGGAQKENLVKRQLAVKDVAFRQPEVLLQIPRRQQRDAFGDAVVNTLEEFAPGIKKLILHRQRRKHG